MDVRQERGDWWELTGGGGLAGIDVADNDDVNVSAVVLTVDEISD